MSDLELVLTMLAEATTTGISKQEQPTGFEESRKVAQRGGVAGRARKDIETEMGTSVITAKNAADFRQLITDIVEDVSVLPENTAQDGNKSKKKD